MVKGCTARGAASAAPALRCLWSQERGAGGPEPARLDPVGPAGTAWGMDASGSLRGSWLLSGSLGGWETSQAEPLAPRSLPPRAKRVGREDVSVIPARQPAQNPERQGGRSGAREPRRTPTLPALCPVPDKPYTSPAPSWHPGSVPHAHQCPVARLPTLLLAGGPWGCLAVLDLRCAQAAPPRNLLANLPSISGRGARGREPTTDWSKPHYVLARGTVFLRERESGCSSSHRHRLLLFSRPRDH